MSKLIAKFVAAPTRDNALRIARHAQKHPFASLMLTSAEWVHLKAAYDLLKEGN